VHAAMFFLANAMVTEPIVLASVLEHHTTSENFAAEMMNLTS
jgi:hypothetical protein